MDKNYDDIFLARWLNNELTSKELEEFKSSPNFLLYQKIADKSAELQAPEFNTEAVFSAIQSKINNTKETKVRKLIPNWAVGFVASIALLFGMFFFLNQPTTISTKYGEQVVVSLPDNSEIVLNSKSTISYSEKKWKKNREVTLKGEAFFKVAKGSDFTVKTNEGNVTVLGTQFNVNTRQNFFDVQCFEGKVQAQTKKHQSILTQGKAFRKIKNISPINYNITTKEPMWKQGESSFNNTSLKYVIIALQNQYNIKIDASKIDVNKKFTGSFTHQNLQTALQTVFVPMKIGTTFTEEKSVSLVKQ